MLQVDQSRFWRFCVLRGVLGFGAQGVQGVQEKGLGVLGLGDFDLDSLWGDPNGEKYVVEGFIVLKEFLRDEALVDVDGGFVEVDEGHEEFHDFFDIEPVA